MDHNAFMSLHFHCVLLTATFTVFLLMPCKDTHKRGLRELLQQVTENGGISVQSKEECFEKEKW